MARMINMPPMAALMPHTFGVYDDFEYDKDIWTDTGDTGGGASVAVGNTFGGACVLTTGATNNNEMYRATGGIFQFAADKPFVATCRLKYTEANTDDANVIFGIQTDLNADALIDDGGGPATSSAYNAVWYKVDGGTRWQVQTSVNASATTTDTQYTPGGGSYQTLRIQYQPKTSAIAEVTFWIDTNGGNDFVQARQYNIHDRAPSIKHTMSSLGGGVVGLIVGVKAGGANSEVLTVDYIDCWQAK